MPTKTIIRPFLHRPTTRYPVIVVCKIPPVATVIFGLGYSDKRTLDGLGVSRANAGVEAFHIEMFFILTKQNVVLYILCTNLYYVQIVALINGQIFPYWLRSHSSRHHTEKNKGTFPTGQNKKKEERKIMEPLRLETPSRISPIHHTTATTLISH